MKDIPFPQANDLGKIYATFLLIPETGLSKFEVMEMFDLVEREGAYYLDALRYIGVVEKVSIKYYLTEIGYTLRKKESSVTRKGFCDVILSHKLLSQLHEIYIDKANTIELKECIANAIFHNTNLNMNTATRRASSIISWFKWIS